MYIRVGIEEGTGSFHNSSLCSLRAAASSGVSESTGITVLKMGTRKCSGGGGVGEEGEGEEEGRNDD